MIRRGIVVTHGVGNQRPVDQLDTVVEPLVDFLGRALGYGNVRLVARTQAGDELLPTARIQLTLRGEVEPFEEWEVREAWWADSFRPSGSATVLAWAFGAALFHLGSTWQHVLVRNLRRVAGKPPPLQGCGVWCVVGAEPLRAFCDAVIWLVVTAGYLAAYAVGAVALLPLYIVLLLPLWLLWPAGAGALQRAVVNWLTGGIGDQHATTNRQVAVAGAADAVARALWCFLGPGRPGGHAYDTVTVVAHSGGCVVSYAALAREDVRRWLRDPKSPRRVTWVTVGSGLNLAWRMRARAKERDRAFWHGGLGDRVNWIDLYARYDPVPQGPAPEAMVAAVLGERARPYASVRVANRDWPFSDHGAYWGNREEVMSRIVHAVADSRLGRRPLNELGDAFARQPTAAGDEEDHPLAAAIRDAVEAAGARRRRVTAVRLLTIVLIAAGAVLLLAGSSPVGGWALDSPIGGVVPDRVGGVDLGGWRPWVVGAVALAVLADALLLTGRLAAHWWSWSQPEPAEPRGRARRRSAIECGAPRPGCGETTTTAGHD